MMESTSEVSGRELGSCWGEEKQEQEVWIETAPELSCAWAGEEGDRARGWEQSRSTLGPHKEKGDLLVTVSLCV